MSPMVQDKWSGNDQHMVSRISKIYMDMKSSGGEVKNESDYITINKRFMNAVLHC